MSDSPGSERSAREEGMCSESSEPLAGRLGAPPHSGGITYKPPCGEIAMCLRVGRMGRLSDDGPGQNNSDPSEGPWGRWSIPPHGGALSSPRPGAVRDNRRGHEMREGRMQTGWRTANAGSRLKPPINQEGAAWKASRPAVLGKTRRTDDSGDRGNVGIIRSPNRASILPVLGLGGDGHGLGRTACDPPPREPDNQGRNNAEGYSLQQTRSRLPLRD